MILLWLYLQFVVDLPTSVCCFFVLPTYFSLLFCCPITYFTMLFCCIVYFNLLLCCHITYFSLLFCFITYFFLYFVVVWNLRLVIAHKFSFEYTPHGVALMSSRRIAINTLLDVHILLISIYLHFCWRMYGCMLPQYILICLILIFSSLRSRFTYRFRCNFIYWKCVSLHYAELNNITTILSKEFLILFRFLFCFTPQL